MEYQPILVRERTTIGQRANHYWSENEPLLVRSRTNSGSYHIPLPHRQRIPPSASPLARELALGGIGMERSYSPLPVEVVDADLTARTYAVGRTRRADT